MSKVEEISLIHLKRYMQFMQTVDFFKPKKIIITALLILLLYGLWELHKSRNHQIFGQIISKFDTQELVIALTFDDGPTATYTDTVLAILQDRGVKATFFVTGSETSTNMSYARRIVQEGHELGNHTFSHPIMIFKSFETIKNEIERTDYAIREAGYQGPIHFRPPYGKKLVALPWYLAKNNRITIMWNLEPESYPAISTDANKIASYVIDRVKPGSILLLHVMYENREESLKALPVIIDGLIEIGYDFKTISELINEQDA